VEIRYTDLGRIFKKRFRQTIRGTIRWDQKSVSEVATPLRPSATCTCKGNTGVGVKMLAARNVHKAANGTESALVFLLFEAVAKSDASSRRKWRVYSATMGLSPGTCGSHITVEGKDRYEKTPPKNANGRPTFKAPYILMERRP
jgi:hypothetical protein